MSKKYRVIVSFTGVKKDSQPDARFTMMHTEEGCVTQTFACVPGEPLTVHRPEDYESLSFVVDFVEVLE